MKKKNTKRKYSAGKRNKKKRNGHWKLWLFLLLLIAGLAYSFLGVSLFKPSGELVEKVKRQVPTDTRYILFVDFSKASAQERLFVYDVRLSKFVYSALVQHGLGRGSTARTPEFSNEKGSKCSSLGLYRVGEYSKIHRIKEYDVPCFRLDGLSETNSNARARGILIHPSLTPSLLPISLWGVPLPLTKESEGCFGVSMRTMWKITDWRQEGRMYLYAYNGEK